MKVLLKSLSILPVLAALTSAQDKCDVSDFDRIDCGAMGTNQQQCEADGCCWKPVDPNPSNLPWCYYNSDRPDPCGDFIWEAEGPGFTQEFYDILYKNYR